MTGMLYYCSNDLSIVSQNLSWLTEGKCSLRFITLLITLSIPFNKKYFYLYFKVSFCWDLSDAAKRLSQHWTLLFHDEVLSYRFLLFHRYLTYRLTHWSFYLQHEYHFFPKPMHERQDLLKLWVEFYCWQFYNRSFDLFHMAWGN